jgi:hypothetical protein
MISVKIDARGVTQTQTPEGEQDQLTIDVPLNGAGITALMANPQILWSDSVEQAADITTSSNVFSAMGSMSRTTPELPSGARMFFWFEVTSFVPSTTDLMYYRIMLDGVEIKRRGIVIGDLGANSLSITGKTGALSAGSHTLSVEWSNSSGTNALVCRPTTVPLEGASLSLQVLSS